MDNKIMSREQISALADNELADSQLDVALSTLRQPEEKAVWDIYHQIGDVLRSEDMAVAMRPDFAARMAARLDAEPVIVAPALSNRVSAEQKRRMELGKRFRKFAMPGFFAVATTSVALISAPHLMVATQDKSVQENPVVMVAAPGQPVTQPSMVAASVPKVAVIAAGSTKEGTILRDPHIDEYLRAHQRFSPSMYGSAQFARSATLAHDSDR